MLIYLIYVLSIVIGCKLAVKTLLWMALKLI